jgi:DNA-binding CsgD family transcriptional regulator
MTPIHKFTRDMLRRASRLAYDKIIRAAKLTPLEASCMDEFILHNKTQFQIAAQLHLSERTVRLYLCYAYNKIANCHLVAVTLPVCVTKSCYALGVGGMQNVWNQSIPTDGDNQAAAVSRAVAIS